MNVTLNFNEFLKDFYKSLTSIDFSTTFLQFIAVIFVRLISFASFTLFEFLRVIWLFHVNKHSTVYDKILFYFEEFLSFFFSYYFIFYYLFRFTFFMFFFVLRSTLIILVTGLEYAYVKNDHNDDFFHLIFQTLTKASLALDSWYSNKKLILTRNSFQFFILWAYYIVFVIILDIYVYPFLVSTIIKLLNKVTQLLILVITLIQTIYTKTAFFITDHVYAFFWVLDKKQRRIYFKKYNRIFFKVIFYFITNLIRNFFFYPIFFFNYINIKLYLIYYFILKTLRFLKSILLLVFDFFTSLYLMAFFCSTIIRLAAFAFNSLLYITLQLLKPFYIIFASFFNVFIQNINQLISTPYFIIVWLLLKLPKSLINGFVFITMYLYLVIMMFFIIIFHEFDWCTNVFLTFKKNFVEIF